MNVSTDPGPTRGLDSLPCGPLPSFLAWVAGLALVLAAMPTQALGAGDDLPRLSSVFSQVDEMLEDVQRIMGFGPRRPIRTRAISKQEFRRLYETRMRQQQKPKEMERELLFLRMFGLVPEDFDYEETVLDLLSEQAWALYDFKRRRLYLADWAPRDALEYALVHELVHAVDDHHFNLRKYVESAPESERQLARLAAMEGQASWVMTQWVMERSDRSLEGNRLLAVAAASATRFEARQFPVYERTPVYFREVLIFPYTDGLLFQDALIQRFGSAGFRKVFEQPPATTQQIIQPELYLQSFDPHPPSMEDISIPKAFKRVYDGTFGQLDHRILLEHHFGENDRGELLDRWRGAAFEIYQERGGTGAVLRYAVRWDSPEAAREYYHLYRQVCERKWEGLELVDSGADRCEGTGPLGRVMLELDGSVLRSVEGLPL